MLVTKHDLKNAVKISSSFQNSPKANLVFIDLDKLLKNVNQAITERRHDEATQPENAYLLHSREHA